MRFFEGLRPQIYIHGAKLRRDKKTGRRLWGLTLIATLTPELVGECASGRRGGCQECIARRDAEKVVRDQKPPAAVQGNLF